MMTLRPASACFFAALLSLTASTPAVAQWIWKDDAGHVVASDQPPPVGVPQSRIIKEPRRRTTTAMTAPASADKGAARSDAPQSLADRELVAKQRQAEADAAVKKADDEANKAKAMQDNCNAVRGNLAALQAGGRAARFNDKGERVYIDDSQRAAEVQKSQSQIAQYCK